MNEWDTAAPLQEGAYQGPLQRDRVNVHRTENKATSREHRHFRCTFSVGLNDLGLLEESEVAARGPAALQRPEDSSSLPGNLWESLKLLALVKSSVKSMLHTCVILNIHERSELKTEFVGPKAVIGWL
ncbi:hypothetical protein NDU88_000316 [Pleurodeles waltl]|uniref:Uncharacterized protein n=1 Tax=Pleurodeles waltl TaxID=8319 RepID=A0AAV7N9Z6_PLEWA|nr:hypothetical protein NDU88_000316 [Pleurodeles waltl]